MPTDGPARALTSTGLDPEDRTLRELRAGPTPAPLAVGPDAAAHVGRLSLPPSIVTRLSDGDAPPGTDDRLQRPVAVYYLYGDERRAVRRFIAENEPLVERGFAHDPEAFPRAWDDVLCALLREEWAFVRERD